MEVHDIVQETGIKTIPLEKKCKKAKWLSGEALQIAVKIKEKIKIGIEEDHSVERWYGDLSNLKNHIDNRE